MPPDRVKSEQRARGKAEIRTYGPPLRGLRILDLCRPEGQLCGRLLADLGAEVIKVEPPGGDAGRRMGPFAGDAANPEASLSFAYFNANKKSVVLDLTAEDGRVQFRALAKDFDVILETFPAGVMRKWGLDHAQLSKENPGLVAASITGFGLSGPHSGYKAPSILCSAMGGVMYLCGSEDRPPLAELENQPYHLASAFAAAGVLMALWHRESTGLGQLVEVSCQEVQAAQQHVLVNYSANSNVLKRAGSRTPVGGGMPYGVYPTSDGFCHIVVIATPHWRSFVDWMGSPDALTDALWDNRHIRIANPDLIEHLTAEFTQKFTKGEFFTEGQARRVTTAPVNTPEEFVRDPHVVHVGLFEEVEHAVLGRTKMVRPPFHLSGSPAVVKSGAPLLGEHTREVLGGTDDSESGGHRSSVEVNRSGSGEMQSGQGPLTGIRVLDFSQAVAGPVLTQLLAAFGAEVIKVESESHQQRGRTREGMDPRIILQQRATFADMNRNKRSITVNMGMQEGRELVRRLIPHCDVVVENFSPRVMDRWGLGYEDLQKLREDIVMVRLPGFGLSGPYRDYVGLAAVAMAVTGMYHLWSYSDAEEPAGPPVWAPDYLSAAFGAVGLLAALRHRRLTGEGQLIELSQMDATAFVMGASYLDYFVNGQGQEPLGNGHSQFAPHGVYPCDGEDRWCAIAVTRDEEWQALLEAMGSPAWGRDPDFSTAEDRLRNGDRLDECIGEWTRGRSPRQVMELLQGTGVPAAAVQDGADLFADPHLRARGFLQIVDHPLTGAIEYPEVPTRLWETPGRLEWWRTMGQDNGYVLGEILGMSEAEIFALQQAGVLK